MQASVSGSAAQEAAPRLLIVDDIADNRAVLARRFQKRGFETVEADGGVAALAVIHAQPFDLVLLDIVMPDMDGRDVLRRIRERHTAVGLPVIMVTAKAQSEDVVEALGLGANDYITKPVDFAVALARVEVQVGRKRAEEQVWRANEALSLANQALSRANADLEHHVEQLRRAVDAAEAANRAKSAFLANMSHEVRTPLNGVLGIAEVLARTISDPHQREMIGIIQTSAGNLDRLLSDVLDVARVESGRIDVRSEPFDLGEAVRSAAALWRGRAQEKNLALHVEIAPAAEGVVAGDETRLNQILTNLLSNAVKFTERGEVTLRVTAGHGWRRFEVRDTGVGFDPAIKERLFARFEQADGSITRRFGGTGLGLSISQELAHLMGGQIDCSSAPGEGSAFVVTLPLPAAEPSAAGALSA